MLLQDVHQIHWICNVGTQRSLMILSRGPLIALHLALCESCTRTANNCWLMLTAFMGPDLPSKIISTCNSRNQILSPNSDWHLDPITGVRIPINFKVPQVWLVVTPFIYIHICNIIYVYIYSICIYIYKHRHYQSLYLYGDFLKWWYPKSSILFSDFPWKSTIQLLGYLHLRNPPYIWVNYNISLPELRPFGNDFPY